MVLGIEAQDNAVVFAVFGNNILDSTGEKDIRVFAQGKIPAFENPGDAAKKLFDRLQTCNITHIGINRSVKNFPVDHRKDTENLLRSFFPQYSSVIDISARSTEVYIFRNGRITDCFTNGKCACGSGSFIDSMAQRLGLTPDAFANEAMKCEEFAHLSGRCAVFCESDIVHLCQKGITKDRIAHGITRAVALNARTLMGRENPGNKILFVGEVSKNPAVLNDLKNIFPESEIDVCPYPFHAFASAFSAKPCDKKALFDIIPALYEERENIKRESPLRLLSEREEAPGEYAIKDTHFESLSLGVDIGSVSTKGALVAIADGKTEVLTFYYRKTLGDPVAAVKDVVLRIGSFIKSKGITYDRIYAGTTGSGRYLTGDFLGADLIKNEITAQTQGCLAFYPETDTIFEIGGQDSKYISVDRGQIADFEMNRVCAAGCGAFLEKQSEILGIDIEDMGAAALKSTNPPSFDYNCTLYTETALKNVLGNVPKEDLAAAVCIAAGKNYINKNVGFRKIGENIVFSGAVAKNSGMVAALEMLTGKKIKVFPYPHISGAIGIAYLTLKECEGREPSFFGFDQIREQKYTLSSFKCHDCRNFCDISVFDVKLSPKLSGDRENVSLSPGMARKFFYNDRCEKYSGKHKGQYEANLFEKYWELCEENMDRVPLVYAGDMTVGYPRGMLFNEYYPLFGAFFKACGFKVVLSDETHRTIAERGSVFAGPRACFPFKCAFGHFADILEKQPDYIFCPRIITGERKSRKPAHYCPYIQAGPDLLCHTFELKDFQNNLDRDMLDTDRILSPTFYMNDGSVQVKKILTELGTALGVPEKTSAKAADIAFDAYWDFKDDLALCGKNILDLYKGYIYVVVGHPYLLYDSYFNMNIGKKIGDMGYMAVPMDFITPKGDTNWHIFQKETERKLKMGTYLKNHPDMKAVVLSCYGCGSDAFSNKFFTEEIGRPCYIMNLDEHTSEVGVQTRLEAFADVKPREQKQKKVSAQISELNKIKDRVLWLPATDFSSNILAEAFNVFGINAKALEESPDTTFGMARKEISEDVCLPCLVTMEDMLWRINQSDFDPNKEAFFQAGANGPCRLGMYPERQKLVLSEYSKKLGKGNIPITVIDNNFFRAGLGLDFALLVWNSLYIHDIFYRLLLHARPYEKEKGSADRVYEKYCYKLLSLMKRCQKLIRKQGIEGFTGKETGEVLKEACEEFAQIADHSVKKPIIGLTGEFYIKLNGRANCYIEKYIENKGFEVWKSPLTEYFDYSNYITKDILKKKTQNRKGIEKVFGAGIYGEIILREKAQNVIDRLEQHYMSVAEPYLDGFGDCNTEKLVDMGSKYLSPFVCGEAICCLGKSEDFAQRNVCGIISISPFNCMPGNVVQMFSQTFRKEHENIPFLCLNYDGYENNYDAIDSFLGSLV